LKANPAGLATMAEALALLLDSSQKPGDDTATKDATEKENKPKKSESVVKIEASASKPDNDLRQTVTVSIVIDESWHLYANPVPADFPGIPTTLTIEAQGKAIDAKVEYPRGKLVKDKVLGDYYVYEDKVKFKANVKRAKEDNSSLKVIVKVQACNEKQCLLPGTVKVNVREE